MIEEKETRKMTDKEFATDVLANQIAHEMVEEEERCLDVEIEDFFSSLEDLLETGKKKKALDSLIRKLEEMELNLGALYIKGFILESELEHAFVEDIITHGLNCCIFKELGIE